MGLLVFLSNKLCLVLSHAEVDHRAADLDSLVVKWEERRPLLHEDHGAELTVIILEDKLTILELDHGMDSGD